MIKEGQAQGREHKDKTIQDTQHNQGHTILLIQFTSDETSKTFLDYDSIGMCVEGVCQLYEQRLKLQNSDKAEVTYDVAELFSYLDSLRDVGVLLYDLKIEAYLPRSRDWLK